MDTAKNSAICSQMGPPHIAAISAATLPSTNQMDVNPAVAASATPKIMMAAIHIMLSPCLRPSFQNESDDAAERADA